MNFLRMADDDMRCEPACTNIASAASNKTSSAWLPFQNPIQNPLLPHLVSIYTSCGFALLTIWATSGVAGVSTSQNLAALISGLFYSFSHQRSCADFSHPAPSGPARAPALASPITHPKIHDPAPTLSTTLTRRSGIVLVLFWYCSGIVLILFWNHRF